MAELYCRFDDPVSLERAARPEDADDDFVLGHLALVAGLIGAAICLIRRKR